MSFLLCFVDWHFLFQFRLALILDVSATDVLVFCNFYEQPLFPGESGVDQLVEIIKVSKGIALIRLSR